MLPAGKYQLNVCNSDPDGFILLSVLISHKAGITKPAESQFLKVRMKNKFILPVGLCLSICMYVCIYVFLSIHMTMSMSMYMYILVYMHVHR